VRLSGDLWPSFAKFANLEIQSLDLDPQYPLLRAVYDRRDYSESTAIWHTLLYVTWYDIGSADRAYALYPHPSRVDPEKLRGLPTGTDRRSFRGNDQAARHLNAFMELPGFGRDIAGFWRHLTKGRKPMEAWNAVRHAFQLVPYGGPWSSYKFAELLAATHGFPLSASDLGVGGGSATAGPIAGMMRLTGETYERCTRDLDFQRELLRATRQLGVGFEGIEHLETAMCDFNAMCEGRYYVGKDIDSQMVAIRRAGDPPDYWEARAEVFRDRYLGEAGGWYGPRKDREKVFKETGVVLA
jgi:Alpha-glutamyl/putrescinyl thymine pyrophosphorylase clade 2